MCLLPSGKRVVTGYFGRDFPPYHVLRGFLRSVERNPGTEFTFFFGSYNQDGKEIENPTDLLANYLISGTENNVTYQKGIELAEFFKNQVKLGKIKILSPSNELDNFIKEYNTNKSFVYAKKDIIDRIVKRKNTAYGWDLFKYLTAIKYNISNDFIYCDLSCVLIENIIDKLKKLNERGEIGRNLKIISSNRSDREYYISLIGIYRNVKGEIQQGDGQMSFGFFTKGYDVREFNRRFECYFEDKKGGDLATPMINIDNVCRLLDYSNNLGSWRYNAYMQNNYISNKRHEVDESEYEYINEVSQEYSLNASIIKLDQVFKEIKLDQVFKETSKSQKKDAFLKILSKNFQKKLENIYNESGNEAIVKSTKRDGEEVYNFINLRMHKTSLNEKEYENNPHFIESLIQFKNGLW